MDVGTIKIKPKERDLKPMSLEEFYAMIDRSLLDAKEGRVKTTEELLKKYKSWNL